MIQYSGEKHYTTRELNDLADKIKAIVYARVSTGDQVDNYSLESQVENCVNHIRNKFDYEEDEIIVLREEGVSGDNPNRPALLHAIFLIENGVGSKLVLLHPNRLSRDLAIQTTVSNRIWQAGADLEFVEMVLDKDSPESLLMYDIQGSFSAYTKRKILMDTKRGRRKMVKKGLIPGLNRIFGYTYDTDKDTLVENEEEKQSYLLMVDWILNGKDGEKMTCSSIAKELALLGLKPAKGENWNQSVVSKILHNETYTGRFYYGKTKVVQKHGVGKQVPQPREDWMMIPVPAYIDEVTFARIQKVLEDNNKNARGTKSKVGYLLKGLARCGRCGASVCAAPVSNNKSRKLHYYGCSAKTKKRYKVGTGETNPLCRGRNWRQDVVDDLVWNYVLSCLQEPDKIIEEVVRQQHDIKQVNALQKKKADLEKRKNEKKKERQRIMSLFTRGTITSEEELDEMLLPVNQQMDRFNNELQNITDRLQAIQMTHDEMQKIKDALQEFRWILDNDGITFEGKRNLVQRFVSKVVLGEDTIEIYTTWRPDPTDPNTPFGEKRLSTGAVPLTLTPYNSVYSQDDGMNYNVCFQADLSKPAWGGEEYQPKWQHLVPELDRLVLMYWGDLLSFEEIAEKTGFDWWTIKELFKQFEVPRMTIAERASYKRQIIYDRLYDLHITQGYSLNDIYRIFKYSPQYVRNVLQENSKISDKE